MNIINKNINELIPYINNPRKISEKAVDMVASSIKNFGFKNPIIIDKNNEIIAGHTRLKASQKLKLNEVPCIIVDDLTPAQIKAFRLADNKVAEFSEWDLDILNIEIPTIDFDMKQFEFDITLPAELNEGLTDEDEIPEKVESVCKLGDLWQLGNHKLLCGDCTIQENYKLLFGEERADLYLSDPPYNVDYEGKTKEKLKIQNDKMTNEHFLTFLTNVISNASNFSKKDAYYYIFHADLEGENFRIATRLGFGKVRQCLVWVKNSLVMGRQDYHCKHEPILCGWKDGGFHNWYSDRKQTTVLEFERPQKNIEHPTMKPINILEYLIKNSSKNNDLILDNFLGSGSTLIACEKTGRRCYGMELDEHYCDVIIKRWEDFTGNKAVLIGNYAEKN
jgi:DNA modification methylase